MSTRDSQRGAQSPIVAITGLVVVVVVLVGVLVTIQVLSPNDSGGTNASANERGSTDGADAAATRAVSGPLHSVSGTLVTVDGPHLAVDATFDGRSQRVSIELVDDTTVYQATIQPSVSLTSGATSIERREITVSDLVVGDAIAVQSVDDFRDHETARATVIERVSIASVER